MVNSATIPYYSRQQLESLNLSAVDVIESIEALLHGQRQGQVWSAPKIAVTPSGGRYMMATLCVADEPPLMAVKSLALNPGNAELGYEQINSVIVLHDSRTGLPVALVDGNWVTAIRTAGLSAVAAKRLANPDASVIAFIGCGVQAHSHLQLFAEMFPLREVRAFGRGEANRESLCRMAQQLGFKTLTTTTAQEALDGADLVVTSVTLDYAMEPFLDARWLKPGAFATVTDLALPWQAESLPAFDRIIIDDLAQEQQMEKKMLDLALVKGDLSGLVAGICPARSGPEERLAFVFRGMGLGDLALAGLAYRLMA